MGKTALSGSGSAGHMGGTEASEVKDGRGAIVQTFKEVMAHNGSHTGFMVWLIKIFSKKRLLRFWLHDLILFFQRSMSQKPVIKLQACQV